MKTSFYNCLFKLYFSDTPLHWNVVIWQLLFYLCIFVLWGHYGNLAIYKYLIFFKFKIYMNWRWREDFKQSHFKDGRKLIMKKNLFTHKFEVVWKSDLALNSPDVHRYTPRYKVFAQDTSTRDTLFFSILRYIILIWRCEHICYHKQRPFLHQAAATLKKPWT